MQNQSIVAEKLVALRGNLTRDKVSKDNNISLSALAMYETGKRMPRDEIKVMLARYYNTTVEELFFTN